MWTQALGGVVTLLGAAAFALIGARRSARLTAPPVSSLDGDVTALAILHGLHI